MLCRPAVCTLSTRSPAPPRRRRRGSTPTWGGVTARVEKTRATRVGHVVAVLRESTVAPGLGDFHLDVTQGTLTVG